MSSDLKGLRYSVRIYHVTVKVIDSNDTEIKSETTTENDDTEDDEGLEYVSCASFRFC